MPKGPQGQKRPADVIGAAIRVARIATGEEDEARPSRPNRDVRGSQGGRARAEKLSAQDRVEIARKASKARWRADD